MPGRPRMALRDLQGPGPSSPGRVGRALMAQRGAWSAPSAARIERKPSEPGLGQRDWLENARRTCTLRLVARDHQGTSVHQEAAMVLLAEVVEASPKSDTFRSPWVEMVLQVEALISAQCEIVLFCAAPSAGRAREGDFGGGAPSLSLEAPNEARSAWLCHAVCEVAA